MTNQNKDHHSKKEKNPREPDPNSKNKPPDEEEVDSSSLSHKKGWKKYLEYSNLAFSLAGACLLGYLIGSTMDQYLDNERPLWTALWMAFFTLAYLVKIILDLIRS